MFFLNNTFFGGKYSADPVSLHISDLNFVKISNGVYDDIYITANPDYNFSQLLWNFSTILWGQFQNSLSGGNINETLKEISSVLIKRRRKGSHEWLTLFEIPIESAESLKFERFDKYVANKTEYEYALVFILGGNIEGSYNINSIKANFEGLFIVSDTHIFSSMIETQVQIQRNHPVSVVNTIDSKYPFVISNNRNNYSSGSVSSIFVRMDNKSCDFDFDGSYKYREDLMDFLCDGRAKFLKLNDGRIWIIAIVGTPSESHDANMAKHTTSFDWVEIGNAEDKFDLYENNFLDFEMLRRV